MDYIFGRLTKNRWFMNILVINANPKSISLTRSLAVEYSKAANKKHQVKEIHISDLKYDNNLVEGYDVIQELEPDLQGLQELILWADHIAIFTPVWWGTVPAAFKGIFDRILLPGFAFQYEEGKQIPKKLLKGRTSELVINLDTPVWYYKVFQGNVIYKHLKRTILDFVGIKNKRTSYMGPVISAKNDAIEGWLTKAMQLGSNL